MTTYRIRHNPDELNQDYQHMLNGLERFRDDWSEGEHWLNACRAKQRELQAILDRKARLEKEMDELNHELMWMTASDRDSAVGLLRRARQMVRLSFPHDLYAFGLDAYKKRRARKSPPEPTDFRVKWRAFNRICLAWKSCGRDTIYDVYMGESRDDTRLVESTTRAEALIEGLEPGRFYYFEVKAKNARGGSPMSRPFKTFTDPHETCPPPQVTQDQVQEQNQLVHDARGTTSPPMIHVESQRNHPTTWEHADRTTSAAHLQAPAALTDEPTEARQHTEGPERSHSKNFDMAGRRSPLPIRAFSDLSATSSSENFAKQPDDRPPTRKHGLGRYVSRALRGLGLVDD